MSKSLLIAFNKSELARLAGFAATFGQPFETVLIPSGSLSESTAKAIATRAEGFSHLAAISSMQAKDILARVAGLLDAAMLTDVIEVESLTSFKRPILAGSIIATYSVEEGPVVLTVRPAGFPEGEISNVETLDTDGPSKASRISASGKSGGRPDLSQAKIIVSGGRPLKDAETFEKVIGGLADALGGAIGATRAAVDSGIAPNELQVGQTGKIVAPNLYIAAGISGSTQHMAGIKDSKIIVAINKDADAPIFEVADLGLVADLYDAIPAIQSSI